MEWKAGERRGQFQVYLSDDLASGFVCDLPWRARDCGWFYSGDCRVDGASVILV